jgi:hypothetical protein
MDSGHALVAPVGSRNLQVAKNVRMLKHAATTE